MTVQLDSQLGLKALKQALCVRFDWSVPCWRPPRGRSWRPRRRPSRAAASRSPWPRAGNPRRSPPPRRHPPPLASASSAGDGTPSAPPSSRRSINCGGGRTGKNCVTMYVSDQRRGQCLKSIKCLSKFQLHVSGPTYYLSQIEFGHRSNFYKDRLKGGP